MNKLFAELQRLYFLPDQQCPGLGPVTPDAVARSLAGEADIAFDLAGPDGRVRTLVVVFEKAADWEAAARLYEAVQADLELPAPAVSVSGKDGYQLWFSLAEAVPAQAARRFLETLGARYLAEMPAARLGLRPAQGQERLPLVPALDAATGKWSAFIDPAMGSMFADEPGLEMAPSLDKQADLLAGFENIKAGDFERAQALLQASAQPAAAPPQAFTTGQGEMAGRARPALTVGSNFTDPKSFLLAVMNDPAASAGQRIKAAKALLPYFEKIDN